MWSSNCFFIKKLQGAFNLDKNERNVAIVVLISIEYGTVNYQYHLVG